MLKLFIPENALEEFCINELSKKVGDPHSDWYKVILKLKVVYTNIRPTRILGPNDPLYEFSTKKQIKLNPDEGLIDLIKSGKHSCFLQESRGIFLLDVDKTLADKLEYNYGIICKSIDNLSLCELSSSGVFVPLKKGEKKYSWDTVFKTEMFIPSNTMIIIDRFIFSYEAGYKSGAEDGIYNLKQILLKSLPDELTCDYQVLIIFDKDSIDDFYNFDDITRELDDYVNIELSKPYNVEIEYLSVSYKCFNYDETHNRRIYTNYYMAVTEHLMKAFKVKSGKAICTESIRLSLPYSTGLSGTSPSEEEDITNNLSQLKDMISEAKRAITAHDRKSKEYNYWLNNEGRKSLLDIKNRLLK